MPLPYRRARGSHSALRARLQHKSLKERAATAIQKHDAAIASGMPVAKATPAALQPRQLTAAQKAEAKASEQSRRIRNMSQKWKWKKTPPVSRDGSGKTI